MYSRVLLSAPSCPMVDPQRGVVLIKGRLTTRAGCREVRVGGVKFCRTISLAVMATAALQAAGSASTGSLISPGCRIAAATPAPRMASQVAFAI
jgi:hypothetical protein